MIPHPSPLRAVFVGGQSLLIRCAEHFLDNGHEIRAIVTTDPAVQSWASRQNLLHLNSANDLLKHTDSDGFDYLFSIANLAVIAADVLKLPQHGAINFHDGILPDYAGLNVPSWALVNRESEHGITWHLMDETVDTGAILKQVRFSVDENETALTLNAKCYEAAFQSFGTLVDELRHGRTQVRPQDGRSRRYFGKHERPPAAGSIDWSRPAADITALVRAMDFGPYPNPLTTAKTWIDGTPIIVAEVELLNSESTSPPGTVVELLEAGVVVSTGTKDVQLRSVRTLLGLPLTTADLAEGLGLAEGDSFRTLSVEEAAALTEYNATVCKNEDFWIRRLTRLETMELPCGKPLESRDGADPLSFSHQAITGKIPFLDDESESRPGDRLLGVLAAYLSRIGRKNQFTLVAHPSVSDDPRGIVASLFSSRLPLAIHRHPDDTLADFWSRFSEEYSRARQRGKYALDIAARHPHLSDRVRLWHEKPPAISVLRVDRLSNGKVMRDAADLTFVIPDDGTEVEWRYRPEVFDADVIARMQVQFEAFLNDAAHSEKPIHRLALLSDWEANQVLNVWNDTVTSYPRDQTVHQLFEAQVRRTPNECALVFEDQTLSYEQLNVRSNQIANYLIGWGVTPGSLVGVLMDRGVDMIAAMMGVLKAGAAYVPLDPDYPRQRLAYMVQDAQACAVVSQSHYNAHLPGAITPFIALNSLENELIAQPQSDPTTPVQASDLAYVIYTSGSTGKPKGVMVEHRNVVNFFVGMDQRLSCKQPGTWLGVTSISFDISVLEIFWTLSRGFRLVLHGSEPRTPAMQHAEQPISFSLFYFASDERENQTDKYKLLMQGARFADENDFEAVWTPERHFHAFGGLYPNPSVAGAALAAITEKLKIRAGSCVLPLHNPIRIAEEWSVVDNISAGRVGISFASGWQPNDFAIAPGNYEARHEKFYDGIEIVRALWRGEQRSFPGPKGDVEVQILPRPVQRELPFWVTAAGNPETFRAAGRIGANMLTHLLGQTIEELAEKLTIYREARRQAVHSGEGHVTLMLHTFIAPDEAFVREQVHEPLKNYLRSATNLVKQHASSFPAFRNTTRQGIDNVFDTLSERDMDALLEHSFTRYYDTSGLFGTPESCLAMVDKLKSVGVNEIACLIDFGVPSETVLQHLPYLNALRQKANSFAKSAPQAADHSLARLMEKHEITHLQCTPSMAIMLATNPDTRRGLRQLKAMLVGGEAFPTELASELTSLISGDVINMYGPTETTIWSCTHSVGPVHGRSIPIGSPIANTRIYIMDPDLQLLPVGVPGELMIGGDGVARGYLNRPELTEERFVSDPFRRGERLYRTGDLARWREDGIVEFLGRLDSQVKIRGHRIELGEIESVLNQHPQVQQSVVVAREDVPGDKRLVGYVIADDGQGATITDLKAFLKQLLPDFMVPATFVILHEFPLTPNNKVDRKKLPAPDAGRPDISGSYVAPRTAQEEVLAEFFAEVLGVDRVGIYDNFVELGGDSLSAVEVFVKIQDAFQVEFPLYAFFRVPTVAGLAEQLAAARPPQPAEQVDPHEIERLIRRSMG